MNGVSTRRIRSVHFSVIQVYLGVVGFLVSAIWLLFYALDHEIFQFHGGAMTWVKLLCASLCSFGA